MSYPHDDDRCHQDSVDAEGFRHACREIGRLADGLGLSDADLGIADVVDKALARAAHPADGGVA